MNHYKSHPSAAYRKVVAAKNTTESRIDYETPGRPIPPIPHADDVQHIALRITPHQDWPES